MDHDRARRRRVADVGARKLGSYQYRRFMCMVGELKEEFPDQDDCFYYEEALNIVLEADGAKAHEKLRQRVNDGIVDAEEDVEEASVMEAVAPDDLPPLPSVTRDRFGDSGGRANERLAIEIAKKLLPFSDITPELLMEETEDDGATAMVAWGYLFHARKNKAGKEKFLYSIAPKIVPTQAQIEKGDEFADDGRETLGLIRRIQTARQNAAV